MEKVTSVYHHKDISATLTLTSGTTGYPKLVPTFDKSYNIKVRDYDNSTMPIVEGDTMLGMPPFILYGEVFMHMAYVRGIQNIIVPNLNAIPFDELVLKKNPNHIISVPSQIHFAFAVSSKLQNKQLKVKTVSVGGNQMLKEQELATNQTLKNTG